MSKKKKGAIELSITAIIILILAIVVLGLALGFIRGMFGKVTKQIDQLISAEPEPPIASRSDPLTISRENIIVDPGESSVIKVSVYNPTGKEWKGATPFVECTQDILSENQSQKRTIKQGEARNFNVILSFSDSIAKDNYLCVLKVEITNASNQKEVVDYQKDIVVKVTR